MSKVNVKLAVLVLVTLAAGVAGWRYTQPKRTVDAAVARLKASAEGTPERDAAQAAIVALGQRSHEALFAMLRQDTDAECAAIPLETFTPAQLAESFNAMGEGGQSAVMNYIHKKVAGGATDVAPVVKAAFDARSADMRKRAVAMAAMPRLNLQADAVAMLRDAHPAVRTSALTAVATRPDLASDEALFPWLNDGDVIVRETCTTVLLARGRTAEEIQFGRKLGHPSAAERLSLLKDLYDEARSRDIGPWLERLSQDHDPMVRAGTLKLAAEIRLSWCDWMAKLTSDADQVVRRIALETEQKLRTGIVPAGAVEK